MTPQLTTPSPQPAPMFIAWAADVDHDRGGLDDLESAFRLVLLRRGRLERLLDMRAPGIIVRNEKRMLRAAVDALLENDEIAATIAHVGIGTFTNYFAYIAGAEDFPIERAAVTYAA